jgi:hypothetical protein
MKAKRATNAQPLRRARGNEVDEVLMLLKGDATLDITASIDRNKVEREVDRPIGKIMYSTAATQSKMRPDFLAWMDPLGELIMKAPLWRSVESDSSGLGGRNGLGSSSVKTTRTAHAIGLIADPGGKVSPLAYATATRARATRLALCLASFLREPLSTTSCSVLGNPDVTASRRIMPTADPPKRRAPKTGIQVLAIISNICLVSVPEIARAPLVPAFLLSRPSVFRIVAIADDVNSVSALMMEA